MAYAFRLGLTGGIGSGKSTVASILTQFGATVFDADAISRSVTAPQGLAIAPIADTFGADFITPAGALDRDRMRALVFSEPSARARLERIIHPLVAEETDRLAQTAVQAGACCLVFDVPLLVESQRWRKKVDQVLVVDCLEATQIARVIARSALTAAEVAAIMAQQASRHQRLKAADVAIFNEGLSMRELASELAELCPRFGLSSATSLALTR
jgi:dephospho-CoA kinase